MVCKDGINSEEAAVFALYQYWPDLINEVWNNYQLNDSSWRGAGLKDDNNVALPFAKVINAVFLIQYALSENYARQWHSTEDYSSESNALHNRFHDEFYIRFLSGDGKSEAVSNTGRFAAEDRTSLYCILFNLGDDSNSVANRASVMIHEAWHHWQHDHGFSPRHPQSGSPPHDCDYFYYHSVSAYDFGKLDYHDTNPNHLFFHSPYQLQCEFDADLAELAQPWIPVVTTQAARASGNGRLAQQFVNTPPWVIGSPRPW